MPPNALLEWLQPTSAQVFVTPWFYMLDRSADGDTVPLWPSFAFRQQYIYVGNQESFHSLRPNEGGQRAAAFAVDSPTSMCRWS